MSGHDLRQPHQRVCVVLPGDRGRFPSPWDPRRSALGLGVLTNSSSSNGSSSCIGECVPHSDAICAIAWASVAMLIKED